MAAMAANCKISQTGLLIKPLDSRAVIRIVFLTPEDTSFASPYGGIHLCNDSTFT